MTNISAHLNQKYENSGFLGSLLRLLRQVFSGSRPPIPIFVRISELAEHISNCYDFRGRPSTQESPGWLIHFLNTRNKELNWGLGEGFFRDELSSGNCLVLLDGLDEAPGRIERESLSRLFENATQADEKCQFVVTTRPLAYAGQSILADFSLGGGRKNATSFSLASSIVPLTEVQAATLRGMVSGNWAAGAAGLAPS